MRSYRIDDVENYRTQFLYDHVDATTSVDRMHTGTLQETRLLDTDFGCDVRVDACETVLPWNIQ